MTQPILSRLTRDAYDGLERVNYSTLKAFARSPAHYRHALTHKSPETDALKMGRVAHLLIFEPELFEQEVAIWEGDRRAGKIWQEFEAANADKDIVRAKDIADLQAIAEAVRTHPDVATHLAAGQAEVTAQWLDPTTEIPCKGRLDWISKSGIIMDLKTTYDASPDTFSRHAHSLNYHVQAAFYSDGVYSATGVRLPFVLVAVEKTEPFTVQVYELPEEVLDIGRATYRAWLRTLMLCRQTDIWPGYSNGPLPLSLPRWASTTSGEDFAAQE